MTRGDMSEMYKQCDNMYNRTTNNASTDSKRQTKTEMQKYEKSGIYNKDKQSWKSIGSVQTQKIGVYGPMITFQSAREAPGDHWRESSGNASICTQVCNGSKHCQTWIEELRYWER